MLGAAPLGEVLDLRREMNDGASRVFHRRRAHPDPELLSRRRHVTPFSLHQADLTGDESSKVLNPDLTIARIGALQEAAAEQFRLGSAENPAECRVHPPEATIDANDGHPYRRIGENSREVRLASVLPGHRVAPHGRPTPCSHRPWQRTDLR